MIYALLLFELGLPVAVWAVALLEENAEESRQIARSRERLRLAEERLVATLRERATTHPAAPVCTRKEPTR
ncbi:hypothetical protein [Streptomyces sp. NPDC088925]|uniref:hypothetical protein n=1 Tax=Streptomyces sp. NPDC088925 TaxID=3365914 RepID=UPI00382E357C